MSKLLIDKYKPNSINDLIFEDDFKKLLNELIETKTLNIIIYGENSCGKTTIIKLIINEYYKNDAKGIDNIINIHETKDQGIHYFRNELHLFCKTCCTIKNKKKMVILDDFDLINDQSQQVFRNLLDEYSNNVIFLMSCSNIHKIINSIQSRQIILKIPKPSHSKLIELCKNIVKKENILIDEDLLEYIVLNSSSSIIRSINYLQKCNLIGDKLDINNISDIMTHVNFNILDNYFLLLKEKKIKDANDILVSIIDYGYSVIDILDSLNIYLKNDNKILNDEEKYKIIICVCKYITLFYDLHENEIELVFLNNTIYKILHNI